MLFRLSNLLCFVFFCTLSFAQKKAISGFYITLQGDTVKGLFPNYRQWNRNPAEVEFNPIGTSESILLVPQTCSKFIIEQNDEYMSYLGMRLVNPIEDINITSNGYYSNKNDENENIVTFLRLVTRVPGCDLYVFNDHKRTNFFYQLPGQPVVELKFKKYYEQEHIIQDVYYKQQLKILFPEAIEQRNLTTKLEKLPYTESGLSEFLQALFPAEVEKHKEKKLTSEWFISSGVSVNAIRVVGDNAYSPVGKDFGTSVSPLLSLSYYLPGNRNFGKYFLFPQLRLFHYKNTNETTSGRVTYSTIYKSDLVMSLELNEGVNLVNKEKIRFYLSGGLGAIAQLNGKELRFVYTAYDQSTFTSSQQSLSALAYSINASAGTTIKNKIMFSATYLASSAMSSIPVYTPKLSSIQIRVGYRFH